MNTLNLAYTAIIPKKTNQPQRNSAIILLHGYGSHMGDLAGLGAVLDGHRVPLFCPNAPIEVEIGFGQKGYSWYQIGDPGTHKYLDTTVIALESTLNEISKKFNIKLSEMVIGGFSQGGMLAMHVGLATENEFKGVIAMSARLIGESNTIINPSKIFISHGTSDQVVSVAEGRRARDTLENYGHDVTYMEYPMAHEISTSCLEDLNLWLKNLFEEN